MIVRRMIVRRRKEIEYCVICHKPTKYTKDIPIDERQHYVEGAGQLCGKCFVEIYVRKRDENASWL